MRRNNPAYIIMIGNGKNMIIYVLFFPIWLWNEAAD